MNPIDIQSRMVAEASNPHKPEGISVFVVTPSEPTARLVAPQLARQLYPGRRFGSVLHAEWIGTPEGYTLPGFAVTVEVLD